MSAGAGAPLLTLTVFQAVVTIACTGLPGFVAGLSGVIDQAFLRSVSRFQLTCLSPCLIFSTFGSRLTLERLGRVWPLVLWSCVQLGTGLVVSRALIRLHAFSAWARHGSEIFPRLLQLAICFQNIAAFTLPMLQTLCQAEGLFQGHEETCFEDGTLMTFGYHVPWDLAMWTRGYPALLAVAQAPTSGDLVGAGHRDPDPASEIRALPHRKLSKLGRGPLDRLASHFRACRTTIIHSVDPIFGALALGILVGITPPLRLLFFGPRAFLGPLGVALKRAGGIVPVLALQILAGTLGCACQQFWGELKMRGSKSAAGTKGPLDRFRQHASQVSWVLTVLVGKLVLLPLLGFCAFSGLSQLQGLSRGPLAGLGGAGGGGRRTSAPAGWDAAAGPVAALSRAVWPEDQLLRAVVMLQWSAPSCLCLISLCHRVCLGERITDAVAALYLVMYAASIITTTGWVSAGLTLF